MNAVCRTRIKICGVMTPAIARCAIEAGADAIGLVFAEGSPRRITEPAARAIIESVPPLVTTVVVHRNADLTRDASTLAMGTDLQLHGDEDEAMIERVRRPVIRGFSFDPEQIYRWDRSRHVRALLIDGPAAGSGTVFDHEALAALTDEVRTPIILAGGLTPENVGDAIRAIRPWAVDVSSGVESAPGVKDEQRIIDFCRAVREA